MKGTLSWRKLVAHDIEIKEKLEKSKKKENFGKKVDYLTFPSV